MANHYAAAPEGFAAAPEHSNVISSCFGAAANDYAAAPEHSNVIP